MMFLNYYLIANRHPHTGAFSDRFRREEGIKNSIFNRGWNPRTVVSEANDNIIGAGFGTQRYLGREYSFLHA